MPKCLFQISVLELNISMLGPTEEGELKESMGANSNTIIGDSKLLHILPPQIKKTTLRYKVIYGCECCISSKIMHLSLIS